jgi:hypothetical protein
LEIGDSRTSASQSGFETCGTPVLPAFTKAAMKYPGQAASISLPLLRLRWLLYKLSPPRQKTKNVTAIVISYHFTPA